MSAPDRQGVVAALGRALDWRLLVAWTAGIALPTSVGTIPMWLVLARMLDHSPRAHAMADHFDIVAFEDVVAAFGREGAALAGAGVLAAASIVLVSPLLAGMTMASARSQRPMSFAELLSGGVAWYARMFRMLLVSLVPLAAVVTLAVFSFKGAERYAARAIHESQAHWAVRGAWLVTLLSFALAHVTLEAGRACLGSTDDPGSAFRAWLRGVRLTWRRPLAVFGLYFGTTLAGLAVAAVFLMARLRVSAASLAGVALGFALTQLAAASIGWARASRLFALVGLSTRIRE